MERSRFIQTWDDLLATAYDAGMTDSEIIVLVRSRYIRYVLEQFKGNQCKAAHALGWHRNTLRTRLSKLGINALEYRQSARMLRRRNISR